MSKFVVAILSAAEISALHHIISDELVNGVLDVENQALLSNSQAKLDEALRAAGHSYSPAIASTPCKPNTPESFRAYERFKLKWMADHGHTLQELFCELDELAENCQNAGSIQELFSEWERDCGFSSEVWPCYEEWLECEAKEEPAEAQELSSIICGATACVYHDGNGGCLLPRLIHRLPDRNLEDAVYGESCCTDFLPAELNDGTKEAAHE